jgi:hypothetical protein
LPIVAILSVVVFVGTALAVAGDTLGYDFLAYHAAARRVLAGQPLYDLSVSMAGGFGLFLYPPTFLPFALPFGLLEPTIATLAWTALLLMAFAAGVALLPVSRNVRWTVLLLAGISWPFVYAIKLGQVGPLLFLAFAVGWRSLDEPRKLGLSAALGTAIKLQPAIVFGWALLTRRWLAVVVGSILLGLLALVSVALAGVGSWLDFATLIRQVADPITTEHNFTPGAVAFQLGASRDIAAFVQAVATVGVVLAVIVAARRASAEAAYLVTVVASQLLSPVLWDHYAMLLLLPIAYLCAAGFWWTVVVPLLTAVPLVGVTPPVVYPVSFAVILVATLIVGVRTRAARA